MQIKFSFSSQVRIGRTRIRERHKRSVSDLLVIADIIAHRSSITGNKVSDVFNCVKPSNRTMLVCLRQVGDVFDEKRSESSPNCILTLLLMFNYEEILTVRGKQSTFVE